MSMDEKRALAQRAVACKRWRPLAGMAGHKGGRIVAAIDGGLVYAPAPYGECDDPPCKPVRQFIPDLTDPATAGCLLELVREAWGDDGVHIIPVGVNWSAMPRNISRTLGRGPTLAHALVAALEAAP